MVFIPFIPTISLKGALVTLINSFIVFIIIVLSDKIINHNMSIKNSFIMSLIAYFLIPILMPLIDEFIFLPFLISFILIPFAVWIILGEILLPDFTYVNKFKVSLIAFVTYLILEYFPLTSYLISMIGI